MSLKAVFYSWIFKQKGILTLHVSKFCLVNLAIFKKSVRLSTLTLSHFILVSLPNLKSSLKLLFPREKESGDSIVQKPHCFLNYSVLIFKFSTDKTELLRSNLTNTHLQFKYNQTEIGPSWTPFFVFIFWIIRTKQMMKSTEKTGDISNLIHLKVHGNTANGWCLCFHVLV